LIYIIFHVKLITTKKE